MREIKFNLVLPIANFNRAQVWAERADELGFYSVSVADHMFTRTNFPELRAHSAQPQMECYTMLAAIAAITKRVRLVPFITPMVFRNPALLAKMLAPLDQISDGRVIAGLGAGWQREEFDIYGYGFASNAERIERLGKGSRSSRRCGPKRSRHFRPSLLRSRRHTAFPSRSRSRIRRS